MKGLVRTGMERMWLAEQPRDLAMLLNIMSSTFFVSGMYFAYRRRFWPAVICAVTTLMLLVCYLDRMGGYYEQDYNRATDGRDER